MRRSEQVVANLWSPSHHNHNDLTATATTDYRFGAASAARGDGDLTCFRRKWWWWRDGKGLSACFVGSECLWGGWCTSCVSSVMMERLLTEGPHGFFLSCSFLNYLFHNLNVLKHSLIIKY